MLKRQPLAPVTPFPDNVALLRGCRSGDPLAWAEIVDRYQRLVYAIPLKEGLTNHEAADVAQETFATLLQSLDTIERPDRLGSWLMTVARRLTWRERHRRERASIDIDTVEMEAADVDGDSATVVWVYDAIQSLDEPCKTLVLSLFFDPAEPSYAEIAIRMGRPLGSVGPLRARCLDRLKSHLGDE